VVAVKLRFLLSTMSRLLSDLYASGIACRFYVRRRTIDFFVRWI